MRNKNLNENRINNLKLNVVSLAIIIVITILFCSIISNVSAVESLNRASTIGTVNSDLINSLELSINKTNNTLYLQFTGVDSNLNGIDVSKYYALEVLNIEKNSVHKYFGKLIFPVYLPLEKGIYVYRIKNLENNLISKIYLEYTNIDNYLVYYNPATKKAINTPANLFNNYSTNNSNSSNNYLNEFNISNTSGINVTNNNTTNGTGRDISLNGMSNNLDKILFTDKKSYFVGETVNINIDIITTLNDFYILSSASKYMFTGYVPDGSPLTFVPIDPGNYTIVIITQENFDNKGLNKEITYTFEVSDKQYDSENIGGVDGAASDVSNLAISNSIISTDIILRDSKGRSAFIKGTAHNTRRDRKIDPGVKDTVKGLARFVSKNSVNMINSIIDSNYTGENYSLNDIYSIDVSDSIELDLNSIANLENSKLVLENVAVDVGQELEVRIEPLLDKQISLKNNIVDSFAMDLSAIDFDNGTFSKIALGKELWKCAEWNYLTQTCNGEWIKIKDLIPGVEYSIEVSPVDPGYAETGVSTINADKPIYLPGETATLYTAVLDRSGFLVQNAHVSVTIITPNLDEYTYTTESGIIKESTRGIYLTPFSNTQQVGNYTIIVSAHGRKVDSTMISKFIVANDYEFDVIRHSELSVDPYKGEYIMQIDVTPRIGVIEYNFTDKIPSNIEILSSSGIVTSNSSGRFIEFYNLLGPQSIYYVYQPPFDIPSVLTFGPSQINYLDSNYNYNAFIEPREWYVAVDPDASTDDGILLYSDRGQDGLLLFRNWTSDLLYSETSSGVDTGGRHSWVKTRCSPYRTQCIIGLNDNDDDMALLMFYTNNWTFVNFGDQSSNLANNEAPFDVECESLSGDCLIAFEPSQTATDAIFQYKIWNGTGLSSVLNQTITGGESSPLFWIKFYPKNGTDTIGVVVQNDGGGNAGTPAIYGAIWNGTNFTQWQLFTNNSITNGDEYTQHKHFDCAWGISKFLCAYGNESRASILSYTYNGTNWSNTGAIYNGMAGEVWEISLCGMDPWSRTNNDYIGVMACSNNGTTNRIDGGVWNGTGFSKTLFNETPYRNNVAECGTNKGNVGYGGQNFKCQWETSGNQIVFLWVNTGEDFVRYGTYTKSTNTYSMSNWTVGNQIVLDGASDVRSIVTTPNSFNDEIFLAYTDGARDSGCVLWTGTSWDGTGCNNAQAFETNGARAGTPWLAFDWFRMQLQPYIIIYNPFISTAIIDYFGITNPSSTSIAYNGTSTILPPNATSSPTSGTEFTTACYFATTSSDDTLCYSNATAINTYTYQSFKFYVPQSVIGITSLKIDYEGRSTSTTASTAIDTNMYVYNWTNDTYNFKKTLFGGGGADSYTELILTVGISDYVRNNTLYVLIQPATASGGVAATARSEIFTDYVALEVNSLSVWRLNNTVNASAVDNDTISYCEWRYYNTTTSINNLTRMSNVSLYYTNISDTTQVPDGTYYAYVFCNDTLANRKNASVILRIDNTAPNITLYNPSNNTNFTVNFALFSWNVTDILNENLLCNVSIDGSIVSPTNVISTHGANTTNNVTSISDGTHLWNVSCTDDARNIGYSQTRIFDTDTTVPSITLDFPTAGSSINLNPLDMNFTVSDAHNLSNCSLYLDNVLNHTLYTLLPGSYNYTIASIPQGLHRWNVTCYDVFNYVNRSLTYNFTVDYGIPIVYLNITDGYIFNGTTPRLNYTAIDNIDTNLSCNITINSVINDINISSLNNTLVSRTQNGLLDGFKVWFVTCIDNAGNYNSTPTRIFQVIGGPQINLLYPPDGIVNSGVNNNFTYNATDLDGLSRCNLYIDGVFNQSNSTLNSSGNNTFFISDFNEGSHFWNVTCNDTNDFYGYSATRVIVADKSTPVISLNFPSGGAVINTTPSKFNFTLTDSFSPNATCNLSIDGISATTNQNFTALNGSITNRTQTVVNGLHYWNVTCIDRGGNYNYSATQNFTVNVTFPINVSVIANKIIYEQNEIVLVNVTIKNESNSLIAANFTLDYIYTNNTFTDVAWWDTNWSKRKPIYVNESNGTARVNKPIRINISFNTGDITSCTNHLRIISDTDLTPVPFNVLQGDDITFCNIIFNGTVSASASNENNYHVYYSKNGSNPNYSNLTVFVLVNDTFAGATINTSIWNNGTGWDIGTALPLPGNHAHIDGNPVVTNTSIYLTRNISTSDYDFVNVTFVWDITSTWDVGPPRDIMVLELTNTSGSSWNYIDELNNTNMTSVSQIYSAVLSRAYMVSGFNLRFRATVDADAEEGGFDNFTIIAYNNIQINISTFAGAAQNWIARDYNATNTTGIIILNFTTASRTIGNYSSVALAYPPTANNRQGTGYDWFTIILDTFGPNITLVAPTTGLTNTSTNITFLYNVSDLATGVANCSLIFNSVVNSTNTSITESINSNFIINMSEGIYNWSVRCFDDAGNNATSQSRIQYIDNTAPIATAISPNDSVVPSGNISFRVNVTDNIDTLILCNLSVDSGNYSRMFNVTNATALYVNITNISAGIHYWNATCYDNINNTGVSLTLNFTAASVPTVTIDNPFDGYGLNNTNITLFFNVSTSATLVNCSLLFSGIYNQTKNASEIPFTSNDGINNFTLTDANYGVYNWSVICFDVNTFNGTTPYRTFQLDNDVANITLLYPVNNGTYSSRSINFTFFTTDTDNLLVCNLSLDGLLNTTNVNTTTNQNKSIRVTNLTLTDHNWSVSCVDNTGFIGYSEVWNFTLQSNVSVTLSAPVNNTLDGDGAINFTYTPQSPADFTSGICSLYIDFSVYDSHAPLTSDVADTFVESGISEGYHSWYINCTDNGGTKGISAIRNFTVDLTNPAVAINSPNGTILTNSSVYFNWTAIDNMDSNLTCNITVNGTIKTPANIASLNNTLTNTTYSGFADGISYYNVSCADDVLRRGTSLTYNFTVSEVPVITLNTPSNNSLSSNQSQIFYFTPTDNSGNISSCKLILDEQLNQTNNTLTGTGVQRSFNVTNLSGIQHNWSINCTDPSGNEAASITRYISIDLTGPNITLYYPQEGNFINSNNITFNWTAIDYVGTNINCSIFVDTTYRGSKVQVSNTTFNFTVSNLLDGDHNWTVICNDSVNNTASSEIRNFTINSADLYVDDARIQFNNTNPNENNTINITVNVTNIGGVTATSLIVDFWDGIPGVGTYIGNDTGTVTFNNGSRIFSRTWNISFGFHTIYVVVDPSNVFGELSEINNNASKNISILRSIITSPINGSMYNYSNVSLNFTLIDYTSGLINYSVFVNNVFTGQNGSVTDNVSETINLSLTQGIRRIKIEALDALGRFKNSTELVLIIDFTAPVPVINTANNTWFNTTSPIINITITDNVDTSINYTLFVNDTVNVTGAVNNNTLTSINPFLGIEGLYQLILNGNDDLNNTANSTARYIYVDTTSPTININSPSSGQNFTTRSIVLNYTFNDTMSPNGTCNSTLDGIIVGGGTPTSGNPSTITLSNVGEGTHYWNITCRDLALNTNVSSTSSFNVYIAPSIVLVSPANNSWTPNSTTDFFFNVSDETGLFNCSMIINGVLNETKNNSLITLNATNNFTVTSMNSGIYTWAVECYDNTTYNAYNISINRTLNVDLIAPSPVIVTSNNTWFNTATPTITINITDNLDPSIDYIIYINQTSNTVGTVTNASATGVTLSALQNGTYNVTLEGIDSAGNRLNSTTIIIYVDTVRPAINLTNPLNNTNLTTGYAELNFTVNDNLATFMTCNLTLDSILSATNLIVNNTQTQNVTFNSLSGGYHYWNVTCIDQAGNRNTSLTSRFYVVTPDIFVSNTTIFFTNDNPVENETINITATIQNIGLADSGNFTVQIRLNSLSGTLIFNDTMALVVNGTVNVTTNYTMGLGDTVFYVLADTPITTNGSILESNESNNNATRLLSVGLWQYVLGLTSDRIAMTDVRNLTIFEWLVSNSSGSKLFATDVDSNINWKNLKAIGINSTNLTSFIDFNTLDVALGSPNFTDSVNRTYTLSGSPIELVNYTIFTKQVISVPIVNSTNNSNFKTGILWDSGDGGIRFNGSQDIMFVSLISKSTQGYNATVDYEIRIPASLRSYKAGQNLVVFYAEIN